MADFPDMPPIDERIREPLRRALAGERSEWPSLTPADVDALVQHGVAPLVYAAAHVPELRDESIRAAAFEALRLDDLRRVLAALAAHDVEALVMKGSALAYSVYAAPELRPRGDTDLLVPRQSVAAMRATMLELGYTEELTSGDEHALRQTTFVRGGHAYDVHWDVTNSPVFVDVFRFDELAARAVSLPRISSDARGLSPVDALLVACVHRVAHHHDNERLIWLADISLLRKRMTGDEHRQFWTLAADRRVVGVCMRSIELASEWCGREADDAAWAWLSEEERTREEPSRVFLDRDIRYGRMMLADLRALPWRARLQRMWQLALPPPAFMRRSFGGRSSIALPWLYIYRGARGIARLFRRA